MTPIETMPLPEDPILAAYAAALNETGHWASIFDAQWRFVFETDELRLSTGEQLDSAVQHLGEHRFGPAFTAVRGRRGQGGAHATARADLRRARNDPRTVP